jgi:Exodeoxyribonuclease V, gamma subunit
VSNRNRRNCLLRCHPLTSRCGFCVWDPLPHLAQSPENPTSWGSSPCPGPSKPDRAGLEPRDILVMCPDMETYALLIVAGFGLGDVVHGADPAHRLRVRLADRSVVPTNALLVVAS